MESRPRPSMNSGSSSPISAGSMSSSFSTLTISFLISNSSSCISKSLGIITFYESHQFSCCYRSVFAIRHAGHVQALAHGDSKAWAYWRDRPPRFALGQGAWIACDRDQQNVGLKQCGDVRKPPVQPHGSTGLAARPLGKHDQAVTLGHGRPAGRQQRFRIEIVADIAGSSDYTAQIPIPPEFLLHDA